MESIPGALLAAREGAQALGCELSSEQFMVRDSDDPHTELLSERSGAKLIGLAAIRPAMNRAVDFDDHAGVRQEEVEDVAPEHALMFGVNLGALEEREEMRFGFRRARAYLGRAAVEPGEEIMGQVFSHLPASPTTNLLLLCPKLVLVVMPTAREPIGIGNRKTARGQASPAGLVAQFVGIAIVRISETEHRECFLQRRQAASAALATVADVRELAHHLDECVTNPY